MRHLKGFTLIELLVAVVILGILLAQAVPAFTQQVATNKMRNLAHAIQAVALKARSEAIKRNKVITVSLTKTDYSMYQTDGAATTLIQKEGLPQGVSFEERTFKYGSSGFVSPLGTEVRLSISHPQMACTQQVRCPTVVLEAGGGVRVCPLTSSCP